VLGSIPREIGGGNLGHLLFERFYLTGYTPLDNLAQRTPVYSVCLDKLNIYSGLSRYKCHIFTFLKLVKTSFWSNFSFSA
jgi:hypothetical protein